MKHLTNAIEAKENFYNLATEHRDYPVKQLLNTYYKTFDNEMQAYFDEVADYGNEEELLEEFECCSSYQKSNLVILPILSK